jgi:CRP/FNR family transcriptional regulator
VPDQAVQDKIILLRSVPYFSELDVELLKKIAQVTFLRKYNSGQIIQIEGQESFGLYIIQSGWLKVFKLNPDGREQTLKMLGPGDVYNAIGLFTANTTPASIEVMDNAIVWSIPRNSIQELIQNHNTLAMSMLEMLANRVQYLVTLVEDLSLRTIESRLAKQLLEQAIDGKRERYSWATQQEMASRLGTVTDVLNRALRNLVDQNLIAVSRKKIEILDEEGLTKIARIDS